MIGTMVLRGWELGYNQLNLIHYPALRRLPTTHAVFSHLTVLLFGYVFWFCALSRTGRRTTLYPQAGLVHTFPLNPGVMWG